MPHKYSHNLQTIYNKDDISYYILGAYITDGCVSKNGVSLTTELKSKDCDWLHNIGKILSPQSPIKKSNGNCYRLRIANKEFATWLINNNCIPNKSLKVKMPIIPKEYLKDFLRGCIDGDGSLGIYKRKNGTSDKLYKLPICYLVSASKIFITELQKQLMETNIHSTIQTKNVKGQTTILQNGQKIIGKHNQYIIKFTGKYCKEVLQYCYYGDHRISMARKNKIAQTIINM